MQEFFFNGWTDKSLLEFFSSHARDYHGGNYQDEDENGGYRLRYRNGESFEIRYWFASHGTDITVVWVNNKLARLTVKECE